MKAIALMMALGASSALADDGSHISLHAAFLTEATDWCATDTGVPVILTMTGLEVYAAPSDSPEAKEIRILRGLQVDRVQVGTLGENTVRERRGMNTTTLDTSNTRSFEKARNEASEKLNDSLGFLKTVARVCKGFWLSETSNVEWQLHDTGGNTIQVGQGRPGLKLGLLIKSGVAPTHGQVKIGSTQFSVKRRQKTKKNNRNIRFTQ